MSQLTARNRLPDLLISAALYAGVCMLQIWTLHDVHAPSSDEGVYLYAAKLIYEGKTPCEDFMTSHSPLVIYGIAAFYKLFGISSYWVRICHVLLCESSIFGVYYLSKKASGYRLIATICGLLFITYVQFQHHDARFVALRQLATASIVWGLLLHFSSRRWQAQVGAGILMGGGVAITFGISTLVIALVFGICVAEIREPGFLKRSLLLGAGMAIPAIFVIWVLTIPNAWDWLVEYNTKLHASLPWAERINTLKRWAYEDSALLVLGSLGSLMVRSRIGRVFASANILGGLSIIAGGPAFYLHHLAPLGATLAISAGCFLGAIYKRLGTPRSVFAVYAILVVVLVQFVPHLAIELLMRKTPEYFDVIEEIRSRPGKLFTIEPIFAIDSGKDIPFHYNAADMRVLRELRKNLEPEKYIELIEQADIVLYEAFATYFIPEEAMRHLEQNFSVSFSNAGAYVYIRNGSNG